MDYQFHHHESHLQIHHILYFKKYRPYLCKNSGWSCWSLWRNQVIQKIYLREAVASAEALSLFCDGVDGDGKAPFGQWKTMENHGKQWCFRCPSRKMITKNREWRDESSKKIGFTISKHHKNQKSIIVKKHWYSEHSHPWFPVTGVGLPTRRAALPGRPCLRRRSARTLRRWRGDGVASARGSQAAAAVVCLGAKSGWWAGKKWIFWDNVNIYHAISIHIYTESRLI